MSVVLRRLPLLASTCLGLLLVPHIAHAAACCVSSSVLGMGRLAIWETAAMGLSLSVGRDTGLWDSGGTWRPFVQPYRQDEARAEWWGMLRVHERLQLAARLPWVQGLRQSGGSGVVTAGGLGDVQAGLRWDIVAVGERPERPALALMAGIAGPTATRAEEATAPYGVDATGRGVWGGSLGVAVEQVWMPWFVRLDARLAGSLPFVRRDLQMTQQFGPLGQLAVSGGREVVQRRLTLALQLLLEREWPYALDGKTEPQSGALGMTASLSAAWRFDWRWTMTAGLASDGLDGLIGARNHTERWSVSLGIRHAWLE